MVYKEAGIDDIVRGLTRSGWFGSVYEGRLPTGQVTNPRSLRLQIGLKGVLTDDNTFLCIPMLQSGVTNCPVA
ncbi:hypothetical protein Tco_0769765 [Tanacetum coccineum]|uniref:Uncharacterized protein n=1 Tax=Tanacetum coccineum TaxID=301880 RepID=A0ABQ4ZAA8_9ASTR